MTNGRRNGFSPVSLWLWLCALLNAAGWTLSALHLLNRTGYAVALALGVVAGVRWRTELGCARAWLFSPARWRRRYRHFFPAAFMFVAALALLGGAWNAP